MGYTAFEFYRDLYYGDSIEESLFPKWEDRASMKLDQLTYGNINDDTRAEFDERIQKATCALADLLYKIDFKTNETLVDKVLNDKTAQNRLCYDTVCEYLSGTGLLYAGVM